MVALDFFDEYHFCRGCPSFVELIGLPLRNSFVRGDSHYVQFDALMESMMLRLLAPAVVCLWCEPLRCTASSVVDKGPKPLHDLVRELGIIPNQQRSA